MSLSLSGLTKHYPGTVALNAVDLQVAAGSIHALVGANGSGKSTLIKILAGVEASGAWGSVTVGGRTVAAGDITPAVARRLGLTFVHQDVGVIDDMSITENVVLASDLMAAPLKRIDWRRARRETKALLDYYGIDAQPDDRVRDLRPVARTMLAIARALGGAGGEQRSAVLILDEPTATLPTAEAEALAALLRKCAGRGQAIVLVSHHLPEILALSERITVLRDGAVSANLATPELNEADLMRHICGRPIERLFPDHKVSDRMSSVSLAGHRGKVLQVEGLWARGLAGIDLAAYRGEILGVAGLRGSGRTTLLRAIFGDLEYKHGTIAFLGRRLPRNGNAKSLRGGMGLVPEDRQRDSVFGTLSLRENHAAASLRTFWRGGVMRRSAERADASTFIDRFRVRTPGVEAPMIALSGGNQQKVVIARWLRRQPSLMLFDEPSQGVDIGARAEIYQAIREAVDDGMAAIVVSSDLAELAQVSDRIVVLRDGRTAHEFGVAPSVDILTAAVCGNAGAVAQ